MTTLTAGQNMDPIAVLNSAKFTEEQRQMVLVRDIEFHSLCEHHMLPFYGKVHVAYLPDGSFADSQKYLASSIFSLTDCKYKSGSLTKSSKRCKALWHLVA